VAALNAIKIGFISKSRNFFFPLMSKKGKRTEDVGEDYTGEADRRPEVAEGSESLSRSLDPKETANVQKKIFHAVKETGRAFKKARDFEIRKIIKRIKSSE
jgi:hypothetical protein